MEGVLLFPCDASDCGSGRIRLCSAVPSCDTWVEVVLHPPNSVVLCGELGVRRWRSNSGTADTMQWRGCRARPVLSGTGTQVQSWKEIATATHVSDVVEVLFDDESAARGGPETRLWMQQLLFSLLQHRLLFGLWRLDCGSVLGLATVLGSGRVAQHTRVVVASDASKCSPEMCLAVRNKRRFRVGGLERVCALLKQTLHAGEGLLLKGPPGTGKTAAVRAVCEEESVPLLYIHGTCSLAQLSAAFAEANRLVSSGAASRAAVFVDETDALQRMEGQFCTLMDKRASRVAVLGATNAQVGPSLRRPGRFDRECIVSIPTLAARREIISIHAVAPHVANNINEVADRTVGYVGADLVALLREMNLEGKSLDEALILVGPSPMRGAAIEVPRVQWSDIGGLEDVKEQLRRAVEWPITRAAELKALGVRAARGVLLHGPPGCAKTTLVRALATNIRASFLMLTTEAVYSPFVGSAEQTVRECFERARGVAPCIVFIDELEAFVSKRGSDNDSGHSVQTRVLATLLNEMDGLDTSDERSVVVVGATNRLDMLDDALVRPGRFDHLLYVRPPQTLEEVLAVLKVHSKNMCLHESVQLEELAKLCIGMSGAQLERICREAGMAALRESLAAECVCWKHFEQSVEQTNSS